MFPHLGLAVVLVHVPLLRRRYAAVATRGRCTVDTTAPPPLGHCRGGKCRTRPFLAAPFLHRRRCTAVKAACTAPTLLQGRCCLCAVYCAGAASGPLLPLRRRRCAAVGTARAVPPLPLRRCSCATTGANTGQPPPLVSAPPALQPLCSSAPVLCRSCFCSAVNTLAV